MYSLSQATANDHAFGRIYGWLAGWVICVLDYTKICLFFKDQDEIFMASLCHLWKWLEFWHFESDVKSNNVSLNEAIDLAQNLPLWRLMSVWCYALLEVHAWIKKKSLLTPWEGSLMRSQFSNEKLTSVRLLLGYQIWHYNLLGREHFRTKTYSCSQRVGPDEHRVFGKLWTNAQAYSCYVWENDHTFKAHDLALSGIYTSMSFFLVENFYLINLCKICDLSLLCFVV